MRLAVTVLVLAMGAPTLVPAQDANVLHSVEYIEARLRAPELHILASEYARQLEGDRSRKVTLAGVDGEPDMDVHWKPVARGATGFNNEPRYELAAYRLQQFFLDEAEYVVPTTVLRAMALEEYSQIRTVEGPTLQNTNSVLFLLSYWLENLAVDTVDPFSQTMFDMNPRYAWAWGNVNLLTHLINHRDANHGNILVSLVDGNSRIFAVDNDVAFRSRVSDQGDRWRRLVVDRLPDETVARLRAVTEDELHEALGVLAEFTVEDGLLQPAERGPNLRPDRGVRVTQERVQFGLTEREIRDVHERIRDLLRDVDRGRITTFPRPVVTPDGDNLFESF
ncbi:MAG: hypothetical protein WEA09_06345 [Gemmatimonadota bacterium]